MIDAMRKMLPTAAALTIVAFCGLSVHAREGAGARADWPGDARGRVFVWDRAGAPNRVVDAAGGSGRECQVRPRGNARFAEGGAMDLTGGACLAQDVDGALLAACKKSNQLTIEATIAPANLSQNGPARIISFSSDAYHRNFTLGQEREQLTLRLRTPRTGENGMQPETPLCRLTAGQPRHVIVSCRPGRLRCFLDGKSVLSTDRVQGDFSNWSPQHLLFGDEWDGGRDWAGRLDGIAIFSRALDAGEAAARFRLARQRAGRPAPPPSKPDKPKVEKPAPKPDKPAPPKVVAPPVLPEPKDGRDWPGWRGPSRNGLTAEPSGWPKGWPPKKLWSKNVGVGCTSPILSEGRMYVMGWSGDRRGNPMGADTLLCLDAATGQELWKQTYAARYQGRHRLGDTSAYGGVSPTPTLDVATGLLYSQGADGDVHCWDTRKNGAPVWSFNLYDRYQTPQRPKIVPGQRDYGFCGSPLLFGDAVVIEAGDDEGTVMAFDKRTGQRRWVSAYRDAAGHTAGPELLRIGGRDYLVVFTAANVVALRADLGHEGQTVGTFPWLTDFTNNISSPGVVGDRVVITSSYTQSRTRLLEVQPGRLREVWSTRDHALVSSPLIFGDQLFLLQNSLMCLDLASGKLKWQGGGFGHGTLLGTGDGKLIVFGKGRLALLEARPKDGKYLELNRVDGVARGICYPHVALARGLLVCKDKDGALVVFSVRE